MRSILVQVVRTIQIFIMAAPHTLIYQLAVLSSLPVSSCARVAVAAGKLAKDEKHQDAVKEAGYDFIVWCDHQTGPKRLAASYLCLYGQIMLVCF